MITFQDSPELHDNGFKTVVGKSGPLTAEDILKIMAHHPATAKRMSKKLWEWFVYKDPEPAVVDRISKVWTSSDLDIKKTMIAIAESPEFWSDRAIGTMIKSPIDFAVGAVRQVGGGAQMLKKRKEFAAFDTPMERQVYGDLYTMFRNTSNQGLSILFPPDVSGWHWGPAWVSASATLDRIRYNDFLFGYRGKNGTVAKALFAGLAALGPKATSAQIVDKLLSALAVKLPAEKRQILVALVEKGGGAKSLKTEAATSELARKAGRLILGSPEYQLC